MLTQAMIGMLLISGMANGADNLPVQVTFADHIAPIVFQQCTACHRPGEGAPFSLLNYADTRKHAKTMVRVVKDRYMPPWKPEVGHGEFRNERRLSDQQIALLEKWVQTGMAEGDPQKTPALPKFPEGWTLGKPDLIVKMDRPFLVPADGPDIYQNFVIPLGLKEDKWVTAIEFRSTAPEVIHHVLYFLDDSGKARVAAGKDGQPGFPGMGFRPTGSLGGWAVGAVPIFLPEGLAYPVTRASDLVLQTHLHPSGKAVSEILTAGLYFAEKPPQRTMLNLQLPSSFGFFANIQIPPGKADYKVSDSFTLPVDADLVSASAHAHYIGKTMRSWAKLPDGSEKKLFFIRDWDFNWQGQYLYKDFVRLPKGTTIHSEVIWDNSANNPRNPSHPPKQVEWGEATEDEMGQVGFRILAAREEEKTTLRNALIAHQIQALRHAKEEGYQIKWEQFGIKPPPIWNLTPTKPKNSDSQKQSFLYKDLNGREWNPLKVQDARANVLFFITTDCPIANGYVPEINSIARDFSGAPVRFFAVHVDSELTTEGAHKHQDTFDLRIPVILDSKHQLVRAVGATRTPEVAVLLPDGKTLYRGRIDDRYAAIGKKRTVVEHHDLRDVLTAIVSGKKIEMTRTEAIGCSIPD